MVPDPFIRRCKTIGRLVQVTAQFWITTIAIVLGPILAVLAARCLEKNDRSRDRKLAVFRDLMATRQITYSPQHVGALNLVELEYHGDDTVLGPFKDLMELLSDEDRWKQANEDESKLRKVVQDMNDLRAILLNSMAKSLNYQMSDIELMRGGYYPQILGQLDDQRVKANKFVADLSEGRGFVPIGVIDYRTVEQIEATNKAIADQLNRKNG